MKLANKLPDHLYELETSLHKRHVRNSPEAVSELLADEFTEFGSSGRVFDKRGIIESLRDEAGDQQIAVEEFTLRKLAPDVVLLTYRSKLAGSQLPGTLRSSIWKLIDGRWQMVFHQGTRIPYS
jgi:hypothetical protein